MDAQLVNDWIRLYSAGIREAESACEGFYELVQNDPEAAWACIIEVCRLTDNEKVLSNLAAGPLEDLLTYHGSKFIDRVETKARQMPAFTYTVKGVWKNAMEPEIWERVRAIQVKHS